MKKPNVILDVCSVSRVWVLLMLTCLFASHGVASGQDVLQKSFKSKGKNITYYVLQPSDTVSGILLLLPGKGENPKSVFKKTQLPAILSTKGYMTIVPNLPYALFADESIRSQLSEIVRIESEGKQAPSLALGGFITGGSVALSFAEHLISQGAANNLGSIFLIDSPLDLQRVYASSRKMRRYACSSVQSEAESTINYLDKALGGSPDDQYAKYVSSAPLMSSEPDGGMAKWLRQVPIRLYSEPDIDFVKERHCSEIEREDLNAVDLERLSKQLRKLGNDHCEYIVTKGRGYQTWNIVEPEELSAWIVKNIKR